MWAYQFDGVPLLKMIVSGKFRDGPKLSSSLVQSRLKNSKLTPSDDSENILFPSFAIVTPQTPLRSEITLLELLFARETPKSLRANPRASPTPKY
jgi:hypothetical protein